VDVLMEVDPGRQAMADYASGAFVSVSQHDSGSREALTGGELLVLKRPGSAPLESLHFFAGQAEPGSEIQI
jgi:hypothetical protein